MTDDGSPSRRAAHRQRTLKEGRVVLGDWATFDCLIRDMSEHGARLELRGPADLPAEFRLLVVSTNTLRPVSRIWQRGLAAGVKFTGPAKVAPPRKTLGAPRFSN